VEDWTKINGLILDTSEPGPRYTLLSDLELQAMVMPDILIDGIIREKALVNRPGFIGDWFA
jgi:hypothetical protein